MQTTTTKAATRTSRPTMVCCGQPGQVIELRGGDEPLRMVRCATCAHREWHLGTERVRVDVAFEALARTYRSAPRAARASRDRAAAQT
ncbi:MAG: hypothetical protein JWM64_667, partial [Frankiales bacterium]|nr:hypothetical protein [Frankiales bacterium]